MSAIRRPLIAGNWKMNGLQDDGISLGVELAQRLGNGDRRSFDMLVCPPFTLIAGIADAVAGSGLSVGGQDCHPEEKGAHTGDTSAAMLADLGCTFAIVGHSERRTNHCELDAAVRAKAQAAQTAGLAAIICIGETEAQRDAGQAAEVNKAQLAGSLPEGAGKANTVIAYEPVWAIGTGRTPTLTEVEEIHVLIRNELARWLGPDEAAAVRILYGGSMKPGNAPELLALPNVDGGLIGGASLNADDFWAIAQSCP